ncbi:PREDICTED: telomere repeat-binding factor 4 [Nelumbo nucifera]|uniref:Telomere repeat-binding factor 4 n=1 Tax=Nelumbo nucifera TaxID=4432 RepID=A0A1U7YWF0_NELNU|nr:PREDICTED: telomere repeat-binding factor 4 [Nelumbo nucifera]
MGNPKQKWTSEEEEALRAGVDKHGVGKWKNIQRDPEFGHCLAARSNIDLKDKWRNMSVSASGQGSREKSRAPKLKALPPIPAVPISTVQSAASSTPVAQDAPADTVMDPITSQEGKNVPRYNAMIFEALSAIKDPNGADISAIIGFIEQKHEVPQNFRRLLSSKLRRLVAQEKLEKVQNCYKIKKDTSFGTRTPTLKQKDNRPRQLQNPGFITSADTIEEAALAAAYKIADAENKSFVAAEAVKEAERVSKMAEETDSLLQLAKEIYEQCSRGEIVLMA